MEAQLPWDRESVLEAICKDYDSRFERLTLVPQGEVAYNFIGEAADGKRYLVKLLGPTRAARRNAARLDFYLTLMEQLCTKGLFRRLPCPI
jgi:hypothetical protein